VVLRSVVDVLVASWMLCSDAKATEEDKWEGKNGRRWVDLEVAIVGGSAAGWMS
jgi:hypothetical protein